MVSFVTYDASVSLIVSDSHACWNFGSYGQVTHLGRTIHTKMYDSTKIQKFSNMPVALILLVKPSKILQRNKQTRPLAAIFLASLNSGFVIY